MKTISVSSYKNGELIKTYNSIASAAADVGVDESSIRKAIKREKRCKGLRWLKQATQINEKLPKILLFDIETLPVQVRVWGLYKQRIPHTNIIKDWLCLSWSAKWLMGSEIMADVLTPKEAKDRDDSRILKSIWTLIDNADIIISHNLKRFDARKLNARFILNGMNPPSPYQMVDTLKHSQSNFAFSSHKLDFLGSLIRNEGKISTDYELWVKCENGEQEALDYMVAYNKEDVVLLEEAYLWLRPWMKSHPNVALYMDLKEPVCANCGSKEIFEEDYYYTPAGKYASVRCECGAIGRVAQSALSLKERRTLNRPIAR